ncbi:MAG: ADP-ribosylglycohydrolase family protein [Chloroflexota bacterium]
MGQLTGDALGSMVEFMSREEIARLYPGGLRKIGPSTVFGTVAGQPTDDSEMALALTRSLLPNGYNPEAAAIAYGRWYNSAPFDIGTATRQATAAMARAAARGESASEAAYAHADAETEANGGLMRQSPLAIWGSSLDSEALDGIVRADTRLTHPSVVCQDASATFIVAVAAVIMDGLSAEAAYKAALEWNKTHGSSAKITRALQDAAHKPPHYQPHQGHVPIALQNAFYQALNATSFEEGIVATVMGGGDTDTNAAIAGALLGAVHGLEAIPGQWREAILTCRPAQGASGVQRPRPEEYWPAEALELAEKLLAHG